MTSEERKQKRYERRKAKRQEKAKLICDKTFEEVFTFENLYEAGKSCCSGVRWKTSTINHEAMLITNVASLYDRIHSDNYTFEGFTHFKTIEHGKERDINALHIRDRTIQKCFCDNIMTDAYSRSFIYDNSASLPNKGMDMTLERLKEHLRYHYRKYGLEGGIYQFDFSSYFASIPHDKAKERLRKYIHDERLQKIGCQLIDDFQQMKGAEQDFINPHGVGLGSQVSQNIALEFASPIDHYIKDIKHIKGYARYMDDGYVISNSLDELKAIKNELTALAESLGIKLNEKKNIITPFKSHSFHFLKMRFRLEPNGKVLVKVGRRSIKAMRKKLRIFRNWVDTGKFDIENVCMSYQSWRAHTLRSQSYKTLHSMDCYFVKLFEKELAERNNKFKCTLNAKWNYEIGWIYYTSIKEYYKKIAELDQTRHQRYMNGFIPLCDSFNWRNSQKSKRSNAFCLLRDIRNKVGVMTYG